MKLCWVTFSRSARDFVNSCCYSAIFHPTWIRTLRIKLVSITRNRRTTVYSSVKNEIVARGIPRLKFQLASKLKIGMQINQIKSVEPFNWPNRFRIYVPIDDLWPYNGIETLNGNVLISFNTRSIFIFYMLKLLKIWIWLSKVKNYFNWFYKFFIGNIIFVSRKQCFFLCKSILKKFGLENYHFAKIFSFIMF